MTADEIDELFRLIITERPEVIRHQQDCVKVRSSTWRLICNAIRREKDNLTRRREKREKGRLNVNPVVRERRKTG